MAPPRSGLALALLAVVASSIIARPGGAQDVHCRRNALVRQIEVQLAQDGDGLPCQVIWREAVGSDQSRLVWRSDSQLDFCTEKARELVYQLIDRGWTCAARVAAAGDRSAPALTLRLEPAAPEADAALPLRAQPDRPEPPAPSGPPAQPEAPHPDRTVLAAAVERDVARLDQLAGPGRGGFEVSAAKLGDLDGDGIEDAVALLAHRPDQGPPSHHLLAYVFDGQTFHPVARRALSEMPADFAGAEFHDIVDGVIELVLHVPQPGDPACCPSGRQRASFILRDRELVAAGKDRPGA